MKAEPLRDRLSLRVTRSLKLALKHLWEVDAAAYRTLSDFVTARLEREAREQAPEFFVATRHDIAGEEPAHGRELSGRPPRRVSAPPSPAGRSRHLAVAVVAVGTARLSVASLLSFPAQALNTRRPAWGF